MILRRRNRPGQPAEVRKEWSARLPGRWSQCWRWPSSSIARASASLADAFASEARAAARVALAGSTADRRSTGRR